MNRRSGGRTLLSKYTACLTVPDGDAIEAPGFETFTRMRGKGRVDRHATMNAITGSCLCGQIGFAVTGAPLRFLYCHCRSCQKASGTLHNANLAFPKEALAWTRGEALIGRFVETVENPGYPRWFCRTCGSPVPKPSRNGEWWVVPSGALDADPGMRPQANIFWSEHAPWYVSGDQLPKYPERMA